MNQGSTFFFVIAAIFVLAGTMLRIFPPKKINAWYGYRTAASMRSPERWKFAQSYSAVLMQLLGAVYACVGVGLHILPFHHKAAMGFALLLLVFSIIAMLVHIERKIHRQFPHG